MIDIKDPALDVGFHLLDQQLSRALAIVAAERDGLPGSIPCAEHVSLVSGEDSALFDDQITFPVRSVGTEMKLALAVFHDVT